MMKLLSRRLRSKKSWRIVPHQQLSQRRNAFGKRSNAGGNASSTLGFLLFSCPFHSFALISPLIVDPNNPLLLERKADYSDSH
jgi:hypothetical protein